jgi:hypothetical protein
MQLLHPENAVRFLASGICGLALFVAQHAMSFYCPVALGVCQHAAILFGGRRVRGSLWGYQNGVFFQLYPKTTYSEESLTQ